MYDCLAMSALDSNYAPTNWCLFMDYVSLKAVVLHNGNKFTSVPVNMKESCV